jgi:acylphosphatase
VRDVIRHVVVRGRVQGVGYRAFVEDEALRRELEGWVRNRRDGTVEAVFSGAEDVVTAIIAACRRGPPAAWVEAVADTAGEGALLAQRRPGERFSMLPTV